MTKLTPDKQNSTFCKKILDLLEKGDIETAKEILKKEAGQKKNNGIPKLYRKPERNTAMELFYDITKHSVSTSTVFSDPVECLFAGKIYHAFVSGPLAVFLGSGLPDHMPCGENHVPEWALEACFTENLPDKIDMEQVMQEAKDRGYTGLKTEAKKCRFYYGPALSENKKPFLLYYKGQHYALPWLELAYAILENEEPINIGQMAPVRKGKPKPVILRNSNGAALVMPFRVEHPENAASRTIRLKKKKQNDRK